MHLPHIIKTHPILFGLGAVASLVLVYKIWSGGGSRGTVVSAPSQQNDVAGAMQLQAQLASINANSNNINTQVGGQVSVATLQAATQQNNDSLAAQTAQIIAGLQATTTQAVSTLQAQVANTQTQAQVQETYLNDNALIAVASLPYMNATGTALQHLQDEITNLGNNTNYDFSALNNWSSHTQGGEIAVTNVLTGAVGSNQPGAGIPGYSPGIAVGSINSQLPQVTH